MGSLIGTLWNLFGKNQWIGIGIYGVTLLLASVGTWMSDVTTVNDLLGFLQWFAPTAVATVTVPSMAIKTAGVIKNGHKPEG